MGVEVPQLDDRTFEELLTDARKRIPVHSDEWTDHNPSDPGITMLEVLAWVAESDIYKLDRITDRHVRKYLRLLGVEPRGPRPAGVSLSLAPPPGLAGTTLPAGTTLAVEDGATTRHFETTRATPLTRAGVAAVVSETPSGRTDHTRANETEGLTFHPFGRAAAVDSAVYLGFDATPAADRLDVHIDFHEASMAAPASHSDETPDFEPSVRVVWERCTDYGEIHDPASWESLGPDPGAAGPARGDDPLRDGTDQFYHGGTVSIPVPDSWTARELLDVDRPLHWLRARIDEPGHEVPPELDAIETGVVTATHRRTHESAPLLRADEGDDPETVRARGGPEVTTARPGQTFVLPQAPVLSATVSVGGTEWTGVPDFDAAGPHDEVYVLDREAGVVRFGDGIRGTVPDPGEPVRATAYDQGGGEAGNVPADAAWRLVDARYQSVDVHPRGPATGGADAESTDEALGRLKADMRTPYRAVTAEDYRYLATHTPGLRFGRAAVHVDEPAADDGCVRPGTVTVAVVPFAPPHRQRPEPSEGFLEAVACHLRRHRLLTDEVEVVGPTYVGVEVEAAVEVAEGQAAEPTTDAVGDRLERFLHPLDGFGGDGWPFGRDVYRSEIFEAIEGVAGVDCVNDVDLAAAPPGARGEAGIDIPPNALAYLDGATVTAAADRDDCGRWSR